MDQNTYQKILSDAAFLKKTLKNDIPKTAIILGSGLGDFVEQMTVTQKIPYEQIPHFIKPTVSGHSGQLIHGTFQNHPILALQGRIHYYEGYSQEEITHAVRVLGMLGVKTLIITNAAGGLATHHKPGDFMFITDHINLMGNNPLLGKNIDSLGVRFLDLTHVYKVIDYTKIITLLKAKNISVSTGVYAALTGPCYETPAEVRMLRTWGIDAVGMSTVPEAIVARHMGMEVVAMSCITNLAAGITGLPLSHEEVKETADRVKSNFVELIRTTFQHLF